MKTPVLSYYTREVHIQKDFLDDLQRRKINEKFHYIGNRQANAWFDICNSPEYEYYRNSKKLLEHCIKDFISDYKTDVNVIAFGPGDALKEKVVVDSFIEKHRASLFFVDASREILNVAIKNTAHTDVLEEIFIADLMNFTDIEDICSYVKRNYNPVNFLTLLGNTLGNYPQAMILKTIRNAMTPGDKILIDCSCKIAAESIEEEVAQVEETIRTYSNSTGKSRILASLSAADIAETDGNIEVSVSTDELFPQMQVVKQFFHFNRSKTIKYNGEDIYFAKGERILVGYSNKYTIESLETLLTSHGLRIVKHAKDDTGKYYQVLCELG